MATIKIAYLRPPLNCESGTKDGRDLELALLWVRDWYALSAVIMNQKSTFGKV
jgi:hypothetical protein